MTSNRPSRFGFLLLASSLIVGCGDDGGEVGGRVDSGPNDEIDGGEETPDAAVPLMGVDALCAPDGAYNDIFVKLAGCQLQFNSINVFGSELLEGAALSQICRDQFATQIEDEAVTVDVDGIEACRTYVENIECLELDIDNLDTTPCGEILVGTVATDGECDINAQCAGDAYCQESRGECGSCQNRLPEGADCGFDDMCSDGTCNSEGECATAVGLDGACEGSDDCVGTLVCSADSMTCINPQAQVGDACDDINDCGGTFGGLYCNDQDLCTALPEVGEPCVADEGPGNQGLCRFQNYEWCDPNTNTCTAPSESDLGGLCNAFAIIGSGARSCPASSMCSNPFGGFEGPAGTCVTPGYQGDSCVAEEESTEPCHPLYNCEDDVCNGDIEYTGMCPEA